MPKVYVDVESCGLHGFPVLIQYAYDDGEIQLYSPWIEPISKTLKLIKDFLFCDGIIGFNLAFDFFHLCKTYTVFSLVKDKSKLPIDLIPEIAELEPLGRDGPCLKPRSACDLMLHARKGPYQSTMDRGDIRIRRVPTPLAWQLAAELERRIPLSDIYFARRKDKTRSKWDVCDIEDADGDIHPDFKDIVLRFAPSSALKALAIDALKVTEDTILLFADVEVDHKLRPVELGYAPFAKAIGSPQGWNGAWPDVIKYHINHWRYNTLARTYAAKDVEYTRKLYEYFGSPELGDNDSILACMVAAVRWRGFNVDVEGMRELKKKTLSAQTKMVNGKEFKIPTAPAPARFYVQELMDETERLCAAKDGFDISTGKVLLQDIAKWKKDCSSCNGEGLISGADCTICEGSGEVRHPAGIRAEEVVNARMSGYEADLYEKFIVAGRFHASFRVIGTLSSRMCLPGNMWTFTSEGPRQICELIDKPFKAIVNGKPYSTKGFFYTGQKEVFEIETKEGHKLQATDNHPVLTRCLLGHNHTTGDDAFKFWKQIKELKVGEQICLNDHQNVEWGGEGEWSEGYILGSLYGDGTTQERKYLEISRLDFYEDDHCMVNFVTSLLKEYTVDFSRGAYHVYSKEIEEIRNKFGCDKRKIVNEHIEMASSDFLKGFISAFFDTDGTTDQGKLQISLGQSNLQRLEAVQRILLRFGMHSKIYKKTEPTAYKIKEKLVPINAKYNLVLGKANARIFLKRIGFQNPNKTKKSEITLGLTNSGKNEYFFSTIKSIKSIGIKAVYDVTVPNIGYFDCNGFIVHNSGSDGLNAQGVKKTKEVRSKFPLAFPGYVLSIGDFAGFEVTLAEASYNDTNLRKQLLTCENCEGQMKHVREPIAVQSFLDKEGIERYIKWRLKTETKNKGKAKENGEEYIEKTKEQILDEFFENDFYCTSCGSTKGKKIHALFGVHVFPEYDYYSLKATEGTKDDKYTKAKSGIFAMLYGGTSFTLKERLGVPEDVALAALAKFHREFPGVKRSQLDVINKLCSMQQVGGIGTKVTWREPAEYIESMFGFRRNFSLENKICKTLFEIANSPPKAWQAIKIKVQRRERIQTVSGALQSALYGAAFGLQASNTRAGINHIIQSSGATITKDVECAIWELQPIGIHEFLVIPMNIHDEIACPTKPELVDAVAKIVKEKTESFRDKVPLIKMDWIKKANSWAEKS